jgi:hypothetical protein
MFLLLHRVTMLDAPPEHRWSARYRAMVCSRGYINGWRDMEAVWAYDL